MAVVRPRQRVGRCNETDRSHETSAGPHLETEDAAVKPPISVEVDGIRFQAYGKALLPFAAPDAEFRISPSAAREALRRTGCVLLRYTDMFDTSQPTNFWHVINDDFVP